MTGVPDRGSIESQAAVFRLLGHPKRLKLAHLCARVLAEGREAFAIKHEVVREYNRLFREQASLNDLNYDIERLVRGGLLERRERRGLNPASRSVRLGIRRDAVEALPLNCDSTEKGSGNPEKAANADMEPAEPEPSAIQAPAAMGVN